MKKLTISVLSLAVVLFITTTSFTISKKGERTQRHNTTPITTYVVNVDGTNAAGFCGVYYVVVTSPCGNMVTMPQVYQEGVSNYVLQEVGPVQGVRVAKLMKLFGPDNTVCSQNMVTSPDALMINYSNNTLSIFRLSPRLSPGDD